MNYQINVCMTTSCRRKDKDLEGTTTVPSFFIYQIVTKYTTLK